jgi:diguanylate cyclase (GGDEF)-like protein
MTTKDAQDGGERRLHPSGGGEDWSAAAFMNIHVLAVPESESVLTVCERMAESRIGQVVVVPDNWKPTSSLDQPPEPVGMFTERDLIRAFATHRGRILEMRVGALMTSPVVTVGPAEDVMDVADLMTLMRIRRLPVVKGGRTLGILTRGRVMEAQSRRLAETTRQNKVLQERVVHDPLTGLANRTLFDRVLERELERMRERGGVVSVLELDIDHFKRVNDTYGHPVGDLVLRQLADVMHSCLRRADLPARVGGEEFAVVLTQGEGHPESVANKLRQAVERESFGEPGDPLRISVSVGCAVAKPMEEPAALFKRADLALYEAKHLGRNRVALG